jgi:GTP-binding protein
MSNPLQGAQFMLAAHRISQLPADQGAEVAFAGRSNAGKSSALNALTNHKGLARTSKTPGRTQQMVAFSLPPHKDVPVLRAQEAQERPPHKDVPVLRAQDAQERPPHKDVSGSRADPANGQPPLDLRLIDLPGYGYAKVPLEMREHWKLEIDAYLHQRQSLRGLVLIVDIRHPLKEFDRQMLEFCLGTQLPCHLLLTKADKLSRNQAMQALATLRKQFVAEGLHATAQIFSSSAGTGVDEAREAVMTLLRQPRVLGAR